MTWRPLKTMAYNFPFTDLCHVEVFPVMEAGAYKKFAAQHMEKLSSLCGCPEDISAGKILLFLFSDSINFMAHPVLKRKEKSSYFSYRDN
jgi:hypothetical protein